MRPGKSWLAGAVEQKLSVITLGVADVERARSFYVDGLGWEAVRVVPGEVVFIQVGHGVLLALWDRQAMAEEAGPVVDPQGAAAAPSVTLGHNVADAESVDRVLRQARAAGAPNSSFGAYRDWGGYSGYFSDVDGYRWEVVHNPGLGVQSDGRVVFEG